MRRAAYLAPWLVLLLLGPMDATPSPRTDSDVVLDRAAGLDPAEVLPATVSPEAVLRVGAPVAPPPDEVAEDAKALEHGPADVKVLGPTGLAVPGAWTRLEDAEGKAIGVAIADAEGVATFADAPYDGR